MGDLVLKKTTTGQITLTPQDVAGNQTVTIPASTGTLSIANTSTSGGIFFGGATSGVLYQDASNLYWDDTNNALGIGTNSPNTYGSVAVYKTGADSRQVIVADNSNSYDPTLAFLRTGVTAWNIGIDQADGSSFKISNSGTYDISSGNCIKVEGTTGNTTLSGTLTTAAKGIAKASLPAGSIVQVVQGTYSTQTGGTGATFTDTGLTASITPTSATNKIFVIVTQTAYFSQGAAAATGGGFRILRGASVIASTVADVTGPYDYYIGSGGASSASNYVRMNMSYLDSPATTSATTYKTQIAAYSSGMSWQVNLAASPTASTNTIILMEVVA